MEITLQEHRFSQRPSGQHLLASKVAGVTHVPMAPNGIGLLAAISVPELDQHDLASCNNDPSTQFLESSLINVAYQPLNRSLRCRARQKGEQFQHVRGSLSWRHQNLRLTGRRRQNLQPECFQSSSPPFSAFFADWKRHFLSPKIDALII